MTIMEIAIIGGGAAGFFSAICAKENHPKANVTLYEKTRRVLTKVKVSGGGRCNVTNACSSINELSQCYPRGGKALKKAFRTFSTTQTMDWFESRGVPLTVQDDDCVFPVSQDSQSIIDCLVNEAKHLKVGIKIRYGVKSINPVGEQLQLCFVPEDSSPKMFDKVIVTTGGSPKRHGLQWLENLGHEIEDPVPSLFTFNMPNESVTELMGIVVESTLVNIQGTKLKSEGPLLVTHWGMSGPAILKLSAFGARWLSECDYTCKLQVNWVSEKNHHVVMKDLASIVDSHPQKILSSIRPYSLPDRLWRYLLDKCGLPVQKKWAELGNKGLNKLVGVLTNDIYSVSGKTTFKEEFVTCGGVSLNSIDFTTMQSRVCKNVFFAGEIIDIDGITGGFNFQAAWTTAYIAGKLQ
ncbi:MAG: NAD(P)/FAD-dependent oxidoreductase [Ectothiorhodospiraceae bacterium]|nr:NAD(P)/FAD-dependent oxidoreductase [Ectothiorhodospiraceae bacterium]